MQSKLVERFLNKAQQHAEHTAFIVGPDQWRFGQVALLVEQWAKQLQVAGISAKQPVGIMCTNEPAFLIALLALRKIGAVVVPLNLQWLEQDLGYVLHHAGLTTIIASADFVPKLAPLGLQVFGVTTDNNDIVLDTTHAMPLPQQSHHGPEELALLIYTSGTTGFPKGVMLSEENLLDNLHGVEQRLAFGPDDKLLLALPLFHSYGLIIALVALLYGIPQVLVPKFQPKQILEAVVSQGVTVLPLVPTFFQFLLPMVAALPTPLPKLPLRFCVSGGAKLPVTLLQQVQAVLGVPVIEGYGLTETAPVLAVNCPVQGPVLGTVGKPLHTVQIQITCPVSHTPLPATEEGEVWAKGGNVMLGYYRQAEETGCVMKEGWLRTGDLGMMDADGLLRITGRIKDLIIKAGENLSPQPIEEVLYQLPGVEEAAVIGMPDERLGEKVVAVVKKVDGLSSAKVMSHCRKALKGLYVPDEVVFLPELPKTATGKIAKKLLPQMVLPAPVA